MDKVWFIEVTLPGGVKCLVCDGESRVYARTEAEAQRLIERRNIPLAKPRQSLFGSNYRGY